MNLSPEQRPYHPQGSAWDLIRSKSPILLADGPAGTGKSRAALEKLFGLANEYKGMRGLILRKTRKSCTDTCLVTWEDEVIPEGHPCLGKKSRTLRENRHSYQIGGSEVVVAGLDDPTKVMSSQWDFIYINEAIEITQEDLETVSTRMRNFKMRLADGTPWTQILMDTNPGPPTHWLWKAHKAGDLPRIATTLKDNRAYFSEARQDWTVEGRIYIENTLAKLTGSRRDRLFLGKWSIAEGARWPMCDPNEHLFDAHVMWPQGMPESFFRFVTVDHGVGCPYCALWHAIDTKGNVYTYKEDYGTEFTADIQAQRVRDLSFDNDTYQAVYMDPSMWFQDLEARGLSKVRRPHEKSAADYYEETLGPDPRFGPVIPGIKDPSKGYPILDALLNRHAWDCPASHTNDLKGECCCNGNGFANWYIERSCTNLWDELNGAIFWKTPQGIQTEKLDPKCPNHAITSAVFGLQKHFNVPTEAEDLTPKAEDIQQARLERRQELSNSHLNRLTNQTRRSRY